LGPGPEIAKNTTQKAHPTQRKIMNDFEDDELVQWFKNRPSLFNNSVEIDGMSLSTVDPDFLDENNEPSGEKTKEEN
jgi:hypothetical protein